MGEKCARHFMTEVLDYIIDNDVPIITTDSWMNVAGERTGQMKHNHHNSLVSGTFYVYRSEWVHSGIEFYRPHVELYPRISHRTKSEHEDDQINKYKRNLETLYPSTGDLLLWSSKCFMVITELPILWVIEHLFYELSSQTVNNGSIPSL